MEAKTNDSCKENEHIPGSEEPVSTWENILGSGAILKKIVKPGEPDIKPNRLERCTINYSLYLDEDLSTVVEKKNKYELYLGDSDVIQGLDVAIQMMELHEIAQIKIEPRLAFGAKGDPPRVPENSTVIYEVELEAIDPEDEISDMTVAERRSAGNKKRERGNWWYGRGENNIAINCYRRALGYLDEVEGSIANSHEEVTDSNLQSLLEDRINVCNNMAAAQIKMQLYDTALESLERVLRCQPNNVKALFRKATVFKAKNDPTTALKYLQKALRLSPDDEDIKKQINLVQKIIQKQKNVEKELARRMINVPKTELVQVKKSTGYFLAVIGTVVAAGLASAIAYKLKYS